VTNDASIGDPHPPDGYGITAHDAGPQNGIGDVVTPFVSLVGVFLGPDRPNLTPAPATRLDFSTPDSRGYQSLSPGLKQPFFIGDGVIDDGVRQRVVIPAGATRLFLGPMDSTGWSNNGGSFSVTVRELPKVPGDVTQDGVVNFDDLLVLAQHYGKSGDLNSGDLNADGGIGFDDLLILSQNYGRSSSAVPETSAVPEPILCGSLSLLLLVNCPRRGSRTR
jgi:hypothetical protein